MQYGNQWRNQRNIISENGSSMAASMAKIKRSGIGNGGIIEK